MGRFFAELRRRHIYRIGAGYVVVAWGIAQVIDFLSQVWALPAWIAQPVSLVLAIGLPITLIAAWMIVGAANETDSSADRLKATATDWVLAAGLAIVIGLIGYQQLSPTTSEFASISESENAADTIAEEIVEEAADRMPNSVAVLPFENQSLDPENAFFAAGVHGEIINQLMKLRNLSVIARSSVMDYPESGMSNPEIADELNVEMIMGGSVRYAGDEVRVITELFDGATNLPVWSGDFNGNLSDIFGIQAEIAMNIANSLQAEFSVEEQESIERAATQSPEALLLYLKAQEVIREGIFGTNVARRTVVQEYLDRALALDAEFALAHALKAEIYSTSRSFDPVTEENWPAFKSEMDTLAETHANVALELDPSLGLAHSALAALHFSNWQGGESQMEVEQALRLNPNDPQVLSMYAQVALYVRDLPEEAVRYIQRAVELDPKNRQWRQQLGYALHLSGRHDEAVEAWQECFALAVGSGAGCLRPLAMAELARDNREAALDALRRAEQGQGYATYADVAHGYGLLGQLEDAQRNFEKVLEVAADQYVEPSVLAWAYMGIGDYDEALRLINAAAENPELLQYVFGAHFVRKNVWFDPVLEEPEWLEARNRLALN